MNTLSLSILTDINQPANFTIEHSTNKTDSIHKSVFQRIGLAFRKSDLIKYRISDNPYAAKSCLVSALLNMGFSSSQSEVLLSAKGWDLRMQLAWQFLSPLERQRAKRLDYSEFENYWENLDFTDFPPMGSLRRERSQPEAQRSATL